MIEKNNYFQFSIYQLTTTIFAVFFVLLPVIFSNQVIETASLPRHILISTTSCILLFVLAIQLISVNKTQLNFTKLHLTLFIFFCWALLSLTWSLDTENSVTELTQLSGYFLIAFLASQILHIHQIKIILSAIYIGAAFAAIVGILQAFNLNPLDLQMTTPLASTFNNKNHASVYFDLIIPLALVTMLTTSSYTKYLSSITFTLAVTFIVLAKTKGSLLGYLVFTLIFIFLIFKNTEFKKHFIQKKKIFYYLFLSLILPAFIYFLASLNINKDEDTNNLVPPQWNVGLTDRSASVRLSFYKNAYSMFKEAPLTGVGYGAFRKGFVPYASSPNLVTSITEDRSVAQLHNDPFQNFLELGIVGGGLIILFFTHLFYKSTNRLISIRTISPDHSEYVLLGSFLALVACITHSFVDFPMRLPSSATLFWFLTGLVILLLCNSAQKEKIKINWITNKTQGIMIILIFILLSIHSIQLYQRYLSASKLQYEATVLLIKSNKNCANAKEKIEQALNVFNESHSIRNKYSQIYSFCDFSPAVKLEAMNRVLNYDSTLTRARLTRAILYINMHEFKLARTDLSYLTSVLPARPHAYLGLADIETLSKNYTKARKYYEKAKTLSPRNKKAIYMLKQFDNKGI